MRVFESTSAELHRQFRTLEKVDAGLERLKACAVDEASANMIDAAMAHVEKAMDLVADAICKEEDNAISKEDPNGEA